MISILSYSSFTCQVSVVVVVFFFLPFRLRSRGFEVAQMEDRRIRDGKVVDSIPDRGDGRIIFCRSKYTQNVKAKEKKK